MDPVRHQVTNENMIAMLKVCEIFRDMDYEVTSQVMCCFFFVASHNDCHKQAMEDYLEISTASGSRNADWLSKKHRLGRDGMNLIRKEVDPSNKRRLTLVLTPEGEELVNRIETILYGS